MNISHSSKRRPVYGIGTNDADYHVQPIIDGKRDVCPYYKTWNDMLGRCYSKRIQSKQPAYIGCSVADEWHSFMTFRKWMMTQNWQGKHIDKDIMHPGNRVYGPDNCIFVDPAINGLLCDHAAKRGKYPQGVRRQLNGKYDARLSKFGKPTFLGYFKTPAEASAIYREAKRLHILTIACCEPDIRVKQGLYRHSELLKENNQC